MATTTPSSEPKVSFHDASDVTNKGLFQGLQVLFITVALVLNAFIAGVVVRILIMKPKVRHKSLTKLITVLACCVVHFFASLFPYPANMHLVIMRDSGLSSSCSLTVGVTVSYCITDCLTVLLLAVVAATEILKRGFLRASNKNRELLYTGIFLAGSVAYVCVIVIPIFFEVWLADVDDPCEEIMGTTALNITTDTSKRRSLPVTKFLLPFLVLVAAHVVLVISEFRQPRPRAAPVLRKQMAAHGPTSTTAGPPAAGRLGFTWAQGSTDQKSLRGHSQGEETGIGLLALVGSGGSKRHSAGRESSRMASGPSADSPAKASTRDSGTELQTGWFNLNRFKLGKRSAPKSPDEANANDTEPPEGIVKGRKNIFSPEPSSPGDQSKAQENPDSNRAAISKVFTQKSSNRHTLENQRPGWTVFLQRLNMRVASIFVSVVYFIEFVLLMSDLDAILKPDLAEDAATARLKINCDFLKVLVLVVVPCCWVLEKEIRSDVCCFKM